jgi:hypothetical protein
MSSTTPDVCVLGYPIRSRRSRLIYVVLSNSVHIGALVAFTFMYPEFPETGMFRWLIWFLVAFASCFKSSSDLYPASNNEAAERAVAIAQSCCLVNRIQRWILRPLGVVYFLLLFHFQYDRLLTVRISICCFLITTYVVINLPKSVAVWIQ